MGCCESKDHRSQVSQKTSSDGNCHATITSQPVVYTNAAIGDPNLVRETNPKISFPRYPTLPAIDHSASTINNGSLSPSSMNSEKNTITERSDSKHDSSSITNFYNRYVSRDLGFIAAEGVESLCRDLEIDPADFRILVLAYSLGAQVMCCFTEEEFTAGCAMNNLHDIKSVKAALPHLVDSVIESPQFTNFYKWAFKFATDHEHGQRSISVDIGTAMWRLVFTKNKPALLDNWIKFVESSGVKGISRDTWDMFLVFVIQIGDDLSLYDDTEAWPSLLDDFVTSLTQDNAAEG